MQKELRSRGFDLEHFEKCIEEKCRASHAILGGEKPFDPDAPDAKTFKVDLQARFELVAKKAAKPVQFAQVTEGKPVRKPEPEPMIMNFGVPLPGAKDKMNMLMKKAKPKAKPAKSKKKKK